MASINTIESAHTPTPTQDTHTEDTPTDDTHTEISLPFIDTNLSIKVSLSPQDLNNEILNNIKKKVKELEGKCNSEGYITQVYSVSSYSNGIVGAEDLSCKTTFNVSFFCNLCNPQLDTYIICKIKSLNSNMICCENGPIIGIIQREKINASKIKFELLAINQYVKVKVLQKRFFPNDINIKILGFLEDIANENEIKKSDLN